MSHVMSELEGKGNLRARGKEFGDALPLKIAMALVNHVSRALHFELRAPHCRALTCCHMLQVAMFDLDLAAIEIYVRQDGGSSAAWRVTYEALRSFMEANQMRTLLFTRRYFNSFTLNIAILSADGKSVTQLLLTSAVTSSGFVYPLPSALATHICSKLGHKPFDLSAAADELGVAVCLDKVCASQPLSPCHETSTQP